MKKVRFIDSMCGTGKSSAIINEINSSFEDERFLVVSPFISETVRFKECCSDFYTPDSDVYDNKRAHLMNLVNSNVNISISHALLKNLSVKQVSKFSEYNLVLDEVLDLIYPVLHFSAKDVHNMVNCGALKVLENGLIQIDDRSSYALEFEKYNKEIELIEEGKLYLFKDNVVICELPLELITSFKTITIMSYMIEGSYLYQMLSSANFKILKCQIDDDYNIVPWTKKLAIARANKTRKLINLYEGNGTTRDLDYKIKQITKNLNYTTQKKKLTKAEKNKISTIVQSYFASLNSKSCDTLYSSFGECIKVKGHLDNHLAYNCRATNDYSDRTTLAYIIEKNPNPALQQYCKLQHGIEINVDMLALDSLIQWVFRGAIRNGVPVNLFLPSEKMRKLLESWGDGYVFEDIEDEKENEVRIYKPSDKMLEDIFDMFEIDNEKEWEL